MRRRWLLAAGVPPCSGRDGGRDAAAGPHRSRPPAPAPVRTRLVRRRSARRVGLAGHGPGPRRRRPARRPRAAGAARPARADGPGRGRRGRSGAVLGVRLAARLGVRGRRAGPHGTPRRRRPDPAVPVPRPAAGRGVRGPLPARRRGTPDDRRRQVDGAGWSLWALRAALDADPDAASARDRAQEHRDLLDRAVEFTLDRTAGGTRLPDPSPDYWELSERSLTLGAVAPLVAGLRAGAAVLSRLRDRRRARTVSGAAGTLAGLVRERFAPAGWTRYGGGRGDGVDAAVTFCLPPFAARADHDVLQALDAYQVLARQPAGGLAPGAGGGGRTPCPGRRRRRSSRWPRRRAGAPRRRTPG